MASKTLAEEAAWRFAEENRMDLVVLNPGFVLGPLLQPSLNYTSEVVLAHTRGTVFTLYRVVHLCHFCSKNL